MSNNIKGICELEKVNIGGLDQWISIRGDDLANPVLLVLHGGPGGSEMPFVNGINRNLQRIFTVVNWDQRGAGKSYSKGLQKEMLGIDRFLSDTHEMVLYLKQRLSKEKLIILGHSWGTFLGLNEAYRHPENLYAYVGAGQMVNGIKTEQIAYKFLLDAAKAKGDKQAIKTLEGKAAFRNGTYVNGTEGWLAQRNLLNKYGGVIHNRKTVGNMTKEFIFSHDYSFRDKLNWQKGQLFTLKALSFDWYFDLDFFNSIKKLEIPIYILAGKYDYNTPFELAEAYCKAIEAPDKEFVCFEESAHDLMYEEPEKFYKVMEMVKEKVCNNLVQSL